MTRHLLVAGNPRRGKSSILNSILVSKGLSQPGEGYFKSGMSFSGGLTKETQCMRTADMVYIDTPGLADPRMENKAADEITKALKSGGHFRIIFVVSLQAGMVFNEDLVTMSRILDSISTNVTFAVVVNQIPEDVWAELNLERIGQMRALINSGMHKTHLVFLEKRDDRIPTGQRWQASPSLLEFIESVPDTFIPANAVGRIGSKTEAHESHIRSAQVKFEAEMARLRDSHAYEMQQAELEYRRMDNEQRELTHQYLAARATAADAAAAADAQQARSIQNKSGTQSTTKVAKSKTWPAILAFGPAIISFAGVLINLFLGGGGGGGGGDFGVDSF
ncbi:hypothetical protein BDR26DRAFT_1011651 [Obelidium mucronatum]|nr:hypothetical protein BDR26DRAFT_1011651 [Obelidium mucronatum]